MEPPLDALQPPGQQLHAQQQLGQPAGQHQDAVAVHAPVAPSYGRGSIAGEEVQQLVHAAAQAAATQQPIAAAEHGSFQQHHHSASVGTSSLLPGTVRHAGFAPYSAHVHQGAFAQLAATEPLDAGLGSAGQHPVQLSAAPSSTLSHGLQAGEQHQQQQPIQAAQQQQQHAGQVPAHEPNQPPGHTGGAPLDHHQQQHLQQTQEQQHQQHASFPIKPTPLYPTAALFMLQGGPMPASTGPAAGMVQMLGGTALGTPAMPMAAAAGIVPYAHGQPIHPLHASALQQQQQPPASVQAQPQHLGLPGPHPHMLLQQQPFPSMLPSGVCPPAQGPSAPGSGPDSAVLVHPYGHLAVGPMGPFGMDPNMARLFSHLMGGHHPAAFGSYLLPAPGLPIPHGCMQMGPPGMPPGMPLGALPPAALMMLQHPHHPQLHLYHYLQQQQQQAAAAAAAAAAVGPPQPPQPADEAQLQPLQPLQLPPPPPLLALPQQPHVPAVQPGQQENQHHQRQALLQQQLTPALPAQVSQPQDAGLAPPQAISSAAAAAAGGTKEAPAAAAAPVPGAPARPPQQQPHPQQQQQQQQLEAGPCASAPAPARRTTNITQRQPQAITTPDGQKVIAEANYKYIVQVGDKWRAQVGNMEDGVQRKYYSAYVRNPAQAAKDADMLLYKLRGPNFPLNFPLSEEERRKLDAMSLQELLAMFHPPQDQVAMKAASALLDLARPILEMAVANGTVAAAGPSSGAGAAAAAAQAATGSQPPASAVPSGAAPGLNADAAALGSAGTGAGAATGHHRHHHQQDAAAGAGPSAGGALSSLPLSSAFANSALLGIPAGGAAASSGDGGASYFVPTKRWGPGSRPANPNGPKGRRRSQSKGPPKQPTSSSRDASPGPGPTGMARLGAAVVAAAAAAAGVAAPPLPAVVAAPSVAAVGGERPTLAPAAAGGANPLLAALPGAVSSPEDFHAALQSFLLAVGGVGAGAGSATGGAAGAAAAFAMAQIAAAGPMLARLPQLQPLAAVAPSAAPPLPPIPPQAQPLGAPPPHHSQQQPFLASSGELDAADTAGSSGDGTVAGGSAGPSDAAPTPSAGQQSADSDGPESRRTGGGGAVADPRLDTTAEAPLGQLGGEGAVEEAVAAVPAEMPSTAAMSADQPMAATDGATAPEAVAAAAAAAANVTNNIIMGVNERLMALRAARGLPLDPTATAPAAGAAAGLPYMVASSAGGGASGISGAPAVATAALAPVSADPAAAAAGGGAAAQGPEAAPVPAGGGGVGAGPSSATAGAPVVLPLGHAAVPVTLTGSEGVMSSTILVKQPPVPRKRKTPYSGAQSPVEGGGDGAAAAAAAAAAAQQQRQRQSALAAAAGIPDKSPYRYIVKIGNKWRAQVGNMEEGTQKKYYSGYVDDPAAAAKDADRILYKLRGPTAIVNFAMADDERADLDGTSLELLMKGFKDGR